MIYTYMYSNGLFRPKPSSIIYPLFNPVRTVVMLSELCEYIPTQCRARAVRLPVLFTNSSLLMLYFAFRGSPGFRT